MICNPCSFNATKIIYKEDLEEGTFVIRENKDEQRKKDAPAKVEILRDCRDCTAEILYKSGFLKLETAHKFCVCFEAGHKEYEIKHPKPLEQSLLDQISDLKNKKAEEIAKKHYENKEKEEFEAQMKYAEERPR